MALPARAHGWSVPLAHSPRDSASHMKGLRYQAWSAPDACGAAVQLSSGNMGCYTNTKAAACLWLAPHLASDGATGQGSLVVGASLPSTWLVQKTRGRKTRTCQMPPAVWLWAIKWCRQKPIHLLQADCDWVVPGKDILYSQTEWVLPGQHIWCLQHHPAWHPIHSYHRQCCITSCGMRSRTPRLMRWYSSLRGAHNIICVRSLTILGFLMTRQ